MGKTNTPIGFKPMPREAETYLAPRPQEEEEEDLVPARPPLVVPIFVDDVEVKEILAAYNLFPVGLLSKFDYQLVQVIAGLEQRVKQLDPDA